MSIRALVAAGALAVMASLTACGGDDSGDGGSDAPAAAPKEDFCQAFNGLFETVLSQATEADSADMVKALKEWAADMEDVGTPDDMPDDARNGFEIFVEQAKKIDDDATLDDLQNLGQDLSADDQKDADAFGEWTTDNCPLDLPSIDPSDLPSIDPSDVPTDPGELESMMSELSASMGS